MSRKCSVPSHSCESTDIILVGCVKSKRPFAGPAKDVYASTLWQYRKASAELHRRPLYILSAMHGLLIPGSWIQRYDLSLSELSASKRREWSLQVLNDLAAKTPVLDGKTIEVHAGKLYVEYGLETGLREAGVIVLRPLARVVGHGPQHAWYQEHEASCSQER